ncbi:MAG: hypothetical protein JNN25_07730, partial [Candidatus Kapabacteria bacterium]|nr:hypothetical protein [Candidatus Kapabacteria bacterium]
MSIKQMLDQDVKTMIAMYSHRTSSQEMRQKAENLIKDILHELSAGHDFEIPEFVSRTKQQALNSLPQTE